VTVRSNGGAALFEDDFDRRYLLGRIGEAAETYQARLYLFCLMETHFHGVLETPRANLGRPSSNFTQNSFPAAWG
jgi:hypothetical protein